MILSWLKVLKYARAYSSIGPFVVIIGHIGADVVRTILR
jgi:hypothetical protein